MEVSQNRGIPKSSTLIGFFIINKPFVGTAIWRNPHIYQYIYIYIQLGIVAIVILKGLTIFQKAFRPTKLGSWNQNISMFFFGGWHTASINIQDGPFPMGYVGHGNSWPVKVSTGVRARQLKIRVSHGWRHAPWKMNWCSAYATNIHKWSNCG